MYWWSTNFIIWIEYSFMIGMCYEFTIFVDIAADPQKKETFSHMWFLKILHFGKIILFAGHMFYR